jgi:hypothetical protein
VERANRLFTWQRVTEQIAAVYEEVLQSQAATPDFAGERSDSLLSSR